MTDCFCRGFDPSEIEAAILQRQAELAEKQSLLEILAEDELLNEPQISHLLETLESIEGEIQWLWLMWKFSHKPFWRCALCPRRQISDAA